MLKELRIQNFAIINQLELNFGKGLVILTGETGAGKSIILDAVEILIGGRADTSMVRAESHQALVEGTFHLAGDERTAILEILKSEDLLDDEDYLTLSREIKPEGRSVARVNGRTVNVGILKSLGAYLIDIHGQSGHLSLLDTHAHLGLLDRYSNADSALSTYRTTYKKLTTLRTELNKLRRLQEDAKSRIELLTYQAEEIEAVNPLPNEDETLKEERDRLANAEALALHAQESLAILDEGNPEAPPVTDAFGEAITHLSALTKIDAAQAEIHERAALILENLGDLSRDLRTYLEKVEFNPSRLEEVEERLDLLQSLKRKYGGSIEAVIAFGADASRELENISTASERKDELEKAEKILLKELAKQGKKLSDLRKAASQKMSKGIVAELADLRMEKAKFAVDFTTLPDEEGLPLNGERIAFSENGFDQVEFLLAPNIGEGLKPLVKVASGGETSRMMLALKNILARADEVPTLIFDEIDQGIGGRIGMVVGEKLWQLGRQHQVFCVTHLPQLAAFGDQHLKVEKLLHDGRTLTRVETLEKDARLLELAQMLGDVGEGTLRSAHEILQAAQEITAT
ncbi:MAG: DNA repair protein RecN [Anaerolineae bacterium]|jgi:DNA repair protein RecN (Recombination protein N)|nr:DNA repair protein RecN [Anaerolineae bacterium]MBT4312527.1 DNA repair protein RecN [Anaerolineae bacterium]MBT4457650.1 DNA repair protein RecN [Anaerolineae bacterium]MBT4841145.1 DNA repair protein RecN [Anaerolineae bacterium]MBT6062336.1 DNA repair protein RecN [Anaerolineae bacterium]